MEHMKIRFHLTIFRRSLVSPNPKGFKRSGGVFLTRKTADCEAKKGWWTLGSRTGLQLLLDSGGDRFAH